MKKSIIFSTLLLSTFFLSFIFPHTAQAACNFYASMTTSTKDVSNWTSTCTIATNSIEGIDKASQETDTLNTAILSLSTGGNITINAGGKLIVGGLLNPGGTLAIQNTGAVKVGTPIYVLDSDADGWPDNFTSTSFFDATSAGRRRLSLMKSYSVADCAANTYNASNICCQSVGGACAADSDCCGTVGVTAICGTNADADNYFSQAAGHTGTCQASLKAYTDCGDNTATAYPGSATCSSTSFTNYLGADSYDYNCSGTSTGCGTVLNYTTSIWYPCDRVCKGCGCGSNGVSAYNTSAEPACGVTGYYCTGTSLHRDTCGGSYGCSASSNPYCTVLGSAPKACQ